MPVASRIASEIGTSMLRRPTAGASTPTTAPAPNASRMNSWSSVHVGRVVPACRQVGGHAVEGNAAPDQQQTLGDVLDRAELVRDVEDRHMQLAVEAREQGGERILGVGIDAGEVGSSRISSRGWATIALAMKARCC